MVLEKGHESKMTSLSLIMLCNRACTIDHESAQSLRMMARHEERRILRTRSRNKKVRREAERQAHFRLAESLERLGLGPAQCFNEGGRYMKSIENRAELCVGAEGAGPALCYIRTKAVHNLEEHSDKLNLCIGATGEEPALCMQQAPHYLEVPERIQLCAGAKPGAHKEPITCLQKVEGAAKALKGAPKRSIGAMVGMLRNDPDSLRARELLVHMCSASVSINPLASAACLKSAPRQLDHDDVVRTCTNVTNSEVLSKVSLCFKLLPSGWTYTQAMKLCAWERPLVVDDTEDYNTTEAAVAAAAAKREEYDKRNSVSATHTTVQCAVEVSRQQIYADDGSKRYWTKEEVSDLCKKENEEGNVRKCALAVRPAGSATSAHNSQFMSPAAITSTCDDAKDETPGLCLSKLNVLSAQRKVTFAPGQGVPEEICTCDDPSYAISCLEGTMRKSNTIALSDLDECFAQPRRIDGACVKTIRSIDGAPTPTAGVSFSLNMALIDQFGSEFESLFGLTDSINDDSDEDSDGALNSRCRAGGMRYTVALDEGNSQGAVLWGIRANKTTCDGLHFSSLIISQPGEIQIKIMPSTTGDNINARESDAFVRPLTVFYLKVLPDPDLGSSSALCTFIFKEGMTGASQLPMTNNDASGSDNTLSRSAAMDAGPSIIRSFVPTQRYLRLFYCSNTFAKWQVSVYPGQQGFHVEFRNGIDSIWTGRGLPKYEQTYEQRLGLSIGIIEEAMKLPAGPILPPMVDRKSRNISPAVDDDGNNYSNSTTNSTSTDGNTTTHSDTSDAVDSTGEILVVGDDDVDNTTNDDEDSVIAKLEAEEAKEEAQKNEKIKEEERNRLARQWDDDLLYKFAKRCNMSVAQVNETCNGTITITDTAIQNCTLGLEESEEEKHEREQKKEDWLLKVKNHRELQENRTREGMRIVAQRMEEINLLQERQASLKRTVVKLERNAQKILRRAYYAKSIRWHPDRWVGLSTYADIVRETFETITEAYDGLQALVSKLGRENLEKLKAAEEERKKQEGLPEGEKSSKDEAVDENEPIITPTPTERPDLFS
jgi:hypothetical protein